MSCGSGRGIQQSFKSNTMQIYDDCSYRQSLNESTSPLMYQINPIAYESCTKCHMSYPGFIGSLGGAAGGFGVGPDRVDIDSDLRGQTRLQSRCPTHKYNPTSYKNCAGARCRNYNDGLPCGCPECQTRDVSNLKDCRPGIIPVESLDTRAFDACNKTKNAYSNRFDYLCHSPQDPARIFFYGNNRRLGAETRLDIRDSCGSDQINCAKMNPPNKKPCNFGQMGCRSLADFPKGVMN